MSTLTTIARSNSVALLLLVLANLIPLAGVFLWGWQLSDLILLYWFESGVVGAYTLVKIALVRTEGPERLMRLLLKLFCIPFFIFHYGVFWLVHGVFVLIFFTGVDIMATRGPTEALMAILTQAGQRMQYLIWPVIGIVVSHGAAFLSDFWENDEERNALPINLMMQPYGRVTVLHITIIAAAFLMLQFGATQLLLVVFVALKIIVDVIAHQAQHRAKVRRLMISVEAGQEGAPA